MINAARLIVAVANDDVAEVESRAGSAVRLASRVPSRSENYMLLDCFDAND